VISSSTYSPVNCCVGGRGRIGGGITGGVERSSLLSEKSTGNPAIEYGRLVGGAGAKVGGAATLESANQQTKHNQYLSVHKYNSHICTTKQLSLLISNTSEAYFMTSFIRPPHYSNHAKHSLGQPQYLYYLNTYTTSDHVK